MDALIAGLPTLGLVAVTAKREGLLVGRDGMASCWLARLVAMWFAGPTERTTMWLSAKIVAMTFRAAVLL
jgi:hypothetical protein